jgi:hypothetical protein
VVGERGGRDDQFRGVLLVSSGLNDPTVAVAAEGFEEIPASSVVTVSRDLRVDVTSLAT